MSFDPKKHLIQLKGKDYLETKWRLVWFREDHPLGSISTEVINTDPLVIRAVVCSGEGQILATAHGSALAKAGAVWSGREVEKAETAAVGRALGHAGYGTQFEADDESEHLADSPNAKNGQQGTQNSAPRQSTTQPRQNAPASQIGGATGTPAPASVEQLTGGLGANVTRIEDAPLPRTKDGVPVLGILDMIEIRRTAWAEKLVTGKEHFANLIDLLYREGSIRDASTADGVLDAIRKNAAEKAKVS